MSKLMEMLQALQKLGMGKSHSLQMLSRATLRTDAVVKKFGKPKQCYANAKRYAAKTGASYMEGYALSHGAPIQHAWCELDGVVHEVTWDHAGTEYLGVTR